MYVRASARTSAIASLSTDSADESGFQSSVIADLRSDLLLKEGSKSARSSIRPLANGDARDVEAVDGGTDACDAHLEIRFTVVVDCFYFGDVLFVVVDDEWLFARRNEVHHFDESAIVTAGLKDDGNGQNGRSSPMSASSSASVMGEVRMTMPQLLQRALCSSIGVERACGQLHLRQPQGPSKRADISVQPRSSWAMKRCAHVQSA
jgi:hypothetical protein